MIKVYTKTNQMVTFEINSKGQIRFEMWRCREMDNMSLSGRK
jgi:hypothetical protein